MKNNFLIDEKSFKEELFNEVFSSPDDLIVIRGGDDPPPTVYAGHSCGQGCGYNCGTGCNGC